MRTGWLAEFMLAAFWVALAGLFWLIFGGALGWWIVLALVASGLRHIIQMHRLESWLRDGRRSQPPQSWGVWGEVFEHYYRMQRRYTKRKKRLARVIREFRESTAAMPDGTIVLDADRRITWFNSAAVRLLGLVGTRDIGQPVTSLLRAPAFERFLREGDFSRPVDVDSPLDLGGRLSIRVVPYGRGQYLMLIRDVTRLQRLENMRRDFVANASHELRSPLTVLGGYLENMADDEAIPEIWEAAWRDAGPDQPDEYPGQRSAGTFPARDRRARRAGRAAGGRARACPEIAQRGTGTGGRRAHHRGRPG